jgi:SAM-dependent methyltransferase
LTQLNAPATVLDIGTGDASLPLAVTENHPHALVTGLDLMRRHLTIARDRVQSQRRIQLLQGDALHLPYADNSMDYVICSLLLHHFTREQVIALLQEAYRCTRHGLIMSDLVRGWLPYTGFKLIQPLFRLHPFTRQDGEVSIMRGFTPSELHTMAQEANLPDTAQMQIHQHPMFRMTLVIDR